MTSDHQHEHDRGLGYDLATLRNRRAALGLLAGAGAFLLAGCGRDEDATSLAARASGSPTTDAGTATVTESATPVGVCSDEIPAETAGPFPGDGSNGPDILTQSGIVRSDIASSFGSSTTRAGGIPLTIELAVQDTSNQCAALSGAAVYVWHCDRDGQYSLYSDAVTGENYLRGVQETDATGVVRFTSIFPAAYQGRWPHVHFEVYASLATATSSGPIKATSQLALPQDACAAVYATTGYEASVRNLAQTSLGNDMVFGDDSAVRQLATVNGSTTTGYTAKLTVPV
jgi:protocatechuate 3,4-dioxygenase beta subunit